MMRSHDEIKMGLECCGKINGNDCGVKCPYVSQLNCIENKDEDALARILQLEEDKVRSEAAITQLSGTIKHLREAVPSWISVQERLPETLEETRSFYHSVTVLASEKGRLMMGYFTTSKDDGSWCFSCVDSHKIFDDWATPTHWMPLPEPPKEVDA